MASLSFMVLWSVLLLVDVVKGQGSVTFRIKQPTGAIYQGAQVQLQCTVEGYSSTTDTVIIYDNFNNGFRNLANEEGKDDDAPENIVSSGIQDVGTSHVLLVTINNIDISFSNTYSCYLAKKAGTIIDQLQLSLNVLLPNPPSCSATPGEDLVWYEGDQITLTCTSDVVEANPLHVVTLIWNVVSPNDNVPSLPSGDSLTSTVSPVLTTDHDGVTFTCLRDADKQNCSIGPIAVRNVQTTDGSLLTASKFSTVTFATEVTVNSTIGTVVTITAPVAGQQMELIVVVIAVSVAVIFIIIIVVVICCVIRSSRKSKSLSSNRRKASSKDVTLIDIIHTGGNETSITETQDNTSKVQHAAKPAEGQVDATVQKPVPQVRQGMSRVTSKNYPKPPSYPRPPKGRESEGEIYTNARVVSGIPEDKTKSEGEQYANARKVSGIPEGKSEERGGEHHENARRVSGMSVDKSGGGEGELYENARRVSGMSVDKSGGGEGELYENARKVSGVPVEKSEESGGEDYANARKISGISVGRSKGGEGEYYANARKVSGMAVGRSEEREGEHYANAIVVPVDKS